MRFRRVASVLILVCPAFSAIGADQIDSVAEIQLFNVRFAAAIKSMDNAAVMALWAKDGVTLLPNTAPIIGKKAINEFMTQATTSLTSAHMQQFELTCHDIAVSSNWASEWCLEHQIVDISPGKPPFEGWGNLLLVLYRDVGGRWQLKREMWNQAVPP